MRYVPLGSRARGEMLSELGAADVEELFAAIPEQLRRPALALPPPLAEAALSRHVGALAAANARAPVSFLGGGCYDHFVPAAVRHLAGQSQLYTAYTPYQPEVSQGTLAVIFEFQTYVAALTGMEVANASMYDGATATAEAALMCLRLKRGRRRVVLAPNLHPQYREVVETYLGFVPGATVQTVPPDGCCDADGTVDADRLAASLDDAACFIVQQPNFFGLVETGLAEVAELVHGAGALLVVAVPEPMALAVLTPPGDFGADIVVGEGQSFGMPPSFGGPGVGFFATRGAFVRQLPGRLVGRTEDREGRPGYVLTLQTREQHIRREKATSNICSNHALGATIFTIYLSLVGQAGLKNLARQNVANTAYARSLCAGVPGYELAFAGPVFNEFVLTCPKAAAAVRTAARAKGVDPGLPLGPFFEGFDERLLVTVTETRTKADIERLAEALSSA